MADTTKATRARARRASLTAAAVALALLFLTSTVLAARFNSVQLPEIRAFLPVCVTFWTTAEFLTAFLLYLQFYVTGTRFFLFVASAYAFSCFLSAPYLLLFPGIFITGEPLGEQQLSAVLWLLWHCAFPAFVFIGQMTDPKLEPQLITRSQARRELFLAAGATLLAATAITGLCAAFRSSLPILVANGHFTEAYSYFGAPAIVVTNAIGCIFLLTRFRSSSPLQIWLSIAIFTQLLDGLLNSLSPARYSLPWYAGKGMTLVTASAVLVMLLVEVAMVYLRVAKSASEDPLTHLRNRRTLDRYVAWNLAPARRRAGQLSLLVIDIDNFKRFNDRYGHSAGDDCLRRVADVIGAAPVRPYDVAARFGGEEFVLLLTDCDRECAATSAERLRSQIEMLHLTHEDAPGHVVTVSIGAATIGAGETVTPDELFKAADAALYRAKDLGRNTVAHASAPVSLAMPPFPT